MATIEFEAGALLRGEIRRYLKKANFERPEIEYMEVKGFLNLSSDFHIRGPENVLNGIKNDLDSWFRQMEANRESR